MTEAPVSTGRRIERRFAAGGGSIPRRTFLAAAAIATARPWTSVRAQAPQQARIGLLSGVGRSVTRVLEDLSDALRPLGWTEGGNLTVDARYADGQLERLPELAGEIVRQSPQIVVASFNAEARALRSATSTIPVVMVFALDPVGEGLARNLARPGGNVTGVMWGDPPLSAKFLQIAKEALPRMSRIGLLYPTGYGMEPYVVAVEDAGRTLGVTTYRFPIAKRDDVASALAEATRLRVDALRLAGGGPLGNAHPQILEFAAAHGIPTFHSAPFAVERGGFMSYAPSTEEMYTLAAGLIDRILRGANPAELAFQYPTRYELRINLTTARRLGITLPSSVQAQAILVK